MIEKLEITGTLPPDTRVQLGSSGFMTVRAGDLDRIRRLNVPDADGKPIIPALEEGHESPAALRKMDTETQATDGGIKGAAKTVTGGSVIEDGSKRIETVVFTPVYVKVNDSWRPKRPA